MLEGGENASASSTSINKQARQRGRLTDRKTGLQSTCVGGFMWNRRMQVGMCFFRRKTPWVASACANCPGCLASSADVRPAPELCPGASERASGLAFALSPPRNSASSVFETVLPETVFGPSPKHNRGTHRSLPTSAKVPFDGTACASQQGTFWSSFFSRSST